MANPNTDALFQRTLRRIMGEIQSIQPHGQSPHNVRTSNTQKQNIVTVDKVLEEIRKLGDAVATSTKQTERRDRCQNLNIPGGSILPSKFYLFKLPAELRLMIYEAAFPSRVLLFHPEGPVETPNIGMRPLPPPAIACTCREAYYFSRERYHKVLYKPLSLFRSLAGSHPVSSQWGLYGAPPPSYTWFNPYQDSLFIDLAAVVQIRRFDMAGFNSSWRKILFRPNQYNPQRSLLPSSNFLEVGFSHLIRSLWQFTTIARKAVLREGSFDSKLFKDENPLLMYGSTEIFPNLQHIYFVTYAFVYPSCTPLDLKGVLEVEDPMVLIDPYDKNQSNRITALLEADNTRYWEEATRQWEGYLDGLGKDPLTQQRSSQQRMINELRSVLHTAKAYMETGFKPGTRGYRVYEDYQLWKQRVLPTMETKVEQERVPAIDPVCLVMENDWELREIKTNSYAREETALSWVRQRDSGGRCQKTA